MELRQLQYFVAVAEEGGFGRAAERLSIVQSAVSQQVRTLERTLGVQLFDRSTRHVRLTGAGERLLPEARAVLAAVERTRRVATGIAAGDDGVLRLGTIHGPGDRIYRLLAELAQLAPGLSVRPRRLPVAERLAAVRAGELDAALVRAASTAPGLNLRSVWSDPLFVAVTAGHPLPSGSAVRLAQFAALPLHLAPREANEPFHDLVTDALRSSGIQPPRATPFTGLQEALSSIAAEPPSWTVLYNVTGLPAMPNVAFHRLIEPTVTTALAVPPGPPNPAVRHLLRALARTAPRPTVEGAETTTGYPSRLDVAPS